MNLVDLYLKMPHPVRQAAVLAASVKHRLTRYGAHYEAMCDMLDASQWWTLDEQRAWQQENLEKLLLEARAHTPYYREVLGALSEDEVFQIARDLDMERLPLLEKSVLKGRTEDFFHEVRESATTSSTSGSTGSPLTVKYDSESMQFRFAVMHQHRIWTGLAPDAKAIRLSGREIIPADRREPPFWVENPLENQLIISSYHMRPEHMPAILEKVRAFEPEIVDGYPSAIAQLAIASAKHDLPITSLKAAVTTAETLSDEMRAQIEDNLGLTVFDYYAASEGVPVIQQCEHGSYHVRTETGIFEFLRPDGTPGEPGEVVEAVVTSFAQWMTPLIRYRTGDLVELCDPDTTCACGRALPIVGGIVGRVEDLVITRDERTIGMFSYRTLKHVPGIAEAQIVQRSPERFLTRVVLDGTRDRGQVEAGIKEIYERVLGYPITSTYEHMDHIPRGANGKFRSMVRDFSEIEDDTMNTQESEDPLASVALVIATFKADDHVLGLLESVPREDLERFATVIVVDSIGTGEMCARLEPFEELVTYHCAEENIGSAGNLAMRLSLAAATDAAYAYAINHDGEVDTDAIAMLVAAAESLDRPLGAAYPTRYHPSRAQYDVTGSRKFALPFLGAAEVEAEEPTTPVQWSSSNGALYGLAPTRAGILPWGDLWMGWEDLAYGRQLGEAGYPQIRVRDAVFEHDYEYRRINLAGKDFYISDKPDWYVYYFARNLILIAQRLEEPARDSATIAFRLLLEATLTAAFRPNKSTRWSYLAQGVRDGLTGRGGKWQLP